ncbi:MAG: formylglycine-generating enzyme family protein [Anaerolineae bacterium]|jgi:formylglycine-generating enzyme required for sulfatase activity
MRLRLGTRYLLLGSVLSLALMAALGGCSGGAGGGDGGQAGSQPTATNTMAFKVELPVTDTPTPVVVNGTVMPTATPGATGTALPTRTPWPTKAPTSAPVDDPAMVYVPGGTFVFGSMDKAEESPRQEAQIDGYNIDRYPVTNTDYQVYVQATGAEAPRHWEEGVIPAGKENHPVVWVTWEDANAYCAWAGKRLPTEMEWEKAARGQDGRKYPWGDAFSSANVNSSESGLRDTSSVDRYAAGASPYGAEDMVGNVWEWTADWFDAYRGSLYYMDRFGETHRAYRGGSWFDGADSVTTTTRGSGEPTFKFSTLGFRCAR